MAGSMNRLHDLLPRIIEDLDEEYPVGVLGLDNWGYVTMGPDRVQIFCFPLITFL